MNNRQPDLIDPPMLAEWLMVPEGTLANWRYLGRGPKFIKVGQRVRYRRDDVEDWLDEQTREGTQ